MARVFRLASERAAAGDSATVDGSLVLKLTIDMIPGPLWFLNLRSALARDWDRIRRAIYRRDGHKCVICGGKGKTHPVEAHERWEYDDKRHVQKLVDIISLCPNYCHKVKHMGLSEKMAAEGKLNMDALIRHFCAVNGCQRSDFTRHRNEMFVQWEARSRHDDWSVDISALPSIVPGVVPVASVIRPSGNPDARAL